MRGALALSLVACSLDNRSPLSTDDSSQLSVEPADGDAGTIPLRDGSAETGGPDLEPLPAGDGSPARLVANADIFDFGGAHAGGAPEVFDWVIRNSGGSTSGPLTLVPPSDPSFAVQNECQSPLAAGAQCLIRVSFAPLIASPFSTAIELVHGAETLSLTLSGKGQHLMTITMAGIGQFSGRVTSSPPGMTCEGNTCVGLYDPVVVTFTARTENGSGSFFSSWNQEHCRAQQSCSFTMTRSGAAGVSFRALERNLIFTSSSRHAPNAGGLAAYDAECNRLATAAGINDTAGDDYIAAMSDATTSLRQRLGNARGWVRMDGLPFADTAASLFDDLSMQYYVAYDELGVQVPTVATDRTSAAALNILTGTLVNGSAAPNHCDSWTSRLPTSSFHIGRVAGGPEAWIDAVSIPCDSPLEYRIVCMGVSRALALPPTPPATALPPEVKQIWVTNTDYVPGSMTPDEKCRGERPVGADDALAYVAYTDRPASAVLVPDGVYVRPDGVLVGLGSDLVSMNIYSTPWIRADGSTAAPLVALPSAWTGAPNPSAVASAAENCNDWQDASDAGIGLVGDYNAGSTRSFYTGAAPRCNARGSLYCVEP